MRLIYTSNRSFWGLFWLVQLLFLADFAVASSGSCREVHNHGHGNGKLEFTENKKQWPAAVKFATDLPGARVFLEQQAITFALYDAAKVDEVQHRAHPDEKNATINAHAYRVKFLASNSQALITGNLKTAGYKNYFVGNDPSRWASGVESFEKVRYQELYAGTDLFLFEQQGRLKYEYVVKPGADPSVIKMQYDGVDGISLVNGELHLKTSLLTVVEQRPFVYQNINGTQVPVPAKFTLTGNVLSFDFPNGYDKKLPLVIDPVLVFSTYTGSGASNYGFTATYDDLGFLYSGGTVYSLGFPVTTGAYQTTFNGNTDMGLIKYDPHASVGSQSRIYATYLGGSNFDYPHSLVTNSNRELIVMGSSASVNYPVTSNAFDQTPNGDSDIVVSKLSADGSDLLASTYLGGTGADGQTPSALNNNYGDAARGDVIVGGAGNILISSTTNSADFPIVNGFQQAFGGNYDAVIVNFNSDLSSIIWSTYLGGSEADAAYSIHLWGNAEEVYVGGGTRSADFPTTAGVIQPAFGGVTDGFAVHISSNGTSLLASTFLGTTLYDQAYFIQLDAIGDVYLFGQTTGPYPVTPGVYNNPGSRHFIHRLSPDFTQTRFSTVIGNGTGSISPTAFLVDNCGQITISGWGTNAGFPVTPNAYQTTVGSFYFLQLTHDGTSLIFASYFGPQNAHVDGGTSRFDKMGNIYQSVCTGAGFPTTTNAWSNNNGSSWNNATFKMEIGQFNAILLASDTTASLAPLTQGCAPLDVHIQNLIPSPNLHYWNFGDGTDTVGLGPFIHKYKLPGVYTISLFVIDSAACQNTSISTTTITVHDPQGSGGSDFSICSQPGSVTLQASGGSTYLWSPANGLSATNIANPIASPMGTVHYGVTIVDANGCTTTDSVSVFVASTPVISMPGPVEVCQGEEVNLSASGNPGYVYSWSPAPGVVNPDSLVIQVAPTATTTFVLHANNQGCMASDSVEVIVKPVPPADAGDDISVCRGSTIELVANQGVGFTYSWMPDAGLTPATAFSVFATPLQSTQFVLTVTHNGCSATDTVNVALFDLPAYAGPDTTVCAGTELTLQASLEQGYYYVWNPLNSATSFTGQNLTINPEANTSYVLTVEKGSCRGTDTVQVKVYSLAVDAGPDRLICPGGSVTLSAPYNQGYSYTWTPENGAAVFNSSIVVEPELPENYFLTMADLSGCRALDTVRVDFYELPAINGEANPPTGTVPLNVMFAGTTTGANSFLWDFGNGQTSADLSPQMLYNLPGEYPVNLTITYGDGCTETRLVSTVIVAPGLAPNIITPNGDGHNDVFSIKISSLPLHLTVFNRWGKVVFERQNYQHDWGAEGLPTGMYFYTATDTAGTNWKGWLEVVR